ncbi:MAG: Asp-tRNA(Asn)/Glu-tRNA(Gln) amidotransferase subunit GatA [Firmicutes bacterium]|nr:Asp-tRNA(Asn)/Glu-tRNA(Gln) amidotransferase subunit GatA [Bacillota bacterium]
MLTRLTVAETIKGLQEKQFSSLELTNAYLERIEALDKDINAYITVTAEKARKQAAASDKRRIEGNALSAFDGVPVGIKDIICTKGVRTTAASKMLENFVPPYSATCWNKLENAGCVLLGKLNMDEFAMGSSTENSAFFTTKNPFDLACVPGGSSGGSAAAVAADMAPFSLGTDTGGSVRQPASFCGTVGLKPTYGRVSRFGVIPYASSLDQVGIFAKSIEDCALILSYISGKDEMDSTSVPVEVPDYSVLLDNGVKGMKIGLPKEYFGEGIAKAISDMIKAQAQKLAEAGAEIVEVSLPHTGYALPAYYIMATAEASANLARYDGVRYGLRVERDNLADMFKATRSQGFGAEVKRRIMLGTYALSSGYYEAYYNKTLQVRTLVKKDFDDCFAAGIDCLLTPTAPTTAFRLDEKSNDPLAMYMSDICTVTVNMAGLPALVVPCGELGGLPVGAQLIGAPFAEEKLFRSGRVLENERLIPQFRNREGR